MPSRRQEREEQRYWSRAAAQHRRRVAASQRLGGSACSPALASSSSIQSSPDSASVAETVAVQAKALMECLLEAPAPPGLLLPGDWQLLIPSYFRNFDCFPTLPLRRFCQGNHWLSCAHTWHWPNILAVIRTPVTPSPSHLTPPHMNTELASLLAHCG
jgi:hypothetical protein